MQEQQRQQSNEDKQNALLDKLAEGTISHEEFIHQRDALEQEQKTSSLEDLKDQLVEGKIMAEEFEARAREIRGPQKPLSPELEKIRDRLKAGIENLIVHGDYYFQNGETELRLRPDLDALGGIYLMDLAGIDYRSVQVVQKGEWIPGGIHIDTGERKEFTTEDDGSVFFDHHGSERGRETSATQIVYETLIEAGLLRREAWLDKFVSFVTEVDNLSYPLDEETFRKKWWQGLYGTHKVLPIDFIARYFKERKDPWGPFPLSMKEAPLREREGETQTLKDVCDNTRERVMMSIQNIKKAVRKMERGGMTQETPELGKLVINVVAEGKGNRIPMGYTAVKALGYDTYILWNEGTKSFFISSQTKNLEPVYRKVQEKIPSAKLIRGTMIICPPASQTKDVTLETLLTSIGL